MKKVFLLIAYFASKNLVAETKDPLNIQSNSGSFNQGINLDNTLTEPETKTEEKKITTAGEAISEKFYKEFWMIDPATDLEGILEANKRSQGFYQDIMLKSLTGFGTGEQFISSDNAEPNPLINIVNYFDCYIPGSSNCAKGTSAEDLSENINKINKLKFLMSSIEQCYANIKGNKKFLENEFGGRKQTKLEKSLGIECNSDDMYKIISDIANTGEIQYKYEKKSGARIKIIESYKNDLENLHTLIKEKLDEEKSKFIEKINSNFADKFQSGMTFVDSTKLDNQEMIKSVFNAFTDASKVNTAGFAINVFSSEDPRIIVNGAFYNKLNTENKKNVQNYRKVKSMELQSSKQEFKKLSKSFGIVKQASISGLTTIINERYAEKGKESELSSIFKKINSKFEEQKQQETKLELNSTESKDKKVKPSEILKELRDGIYMNNLMNYKRYLVMEKSLMSLTTMQISSLNELAKKINSMSDSMQSTAITIDAGDNFTGQIGQKPEVTEVE